MWSAMKTAILVTVVTLLIWLWAEAEGLRSTTVTPRIQFVAPSEDVSVRVLEPDLRSEIIRVRIEGSSVALDEVEQVLRSPLRLVAGVGGIPDEPGEHVIRLQDALRNHPDLVRRGISVSDVQPATATIRVARLVTRDLPVRVDLTGIENDGEVTVSPATVRVTMPEQAAALLTDRGTVGGGASGAPFATAIISDDERRLLRDDGPQTVRAQICLPEVLDGFDPVRAATDTVRVTLRIRKQTDEIVLPTVPVWITVPHTEGDDWDIRVLDGLVRNVTVTGPRDLIDQVRNRELVPIAFVVLSSDDLEAGVTSKLAVFAPVRASMIDPSSRPADPAAAARSDTAVLEQVPPLQFSAQDRRIGLEITKRQPSPAPGGLPPTPIAPLPGGR